MILWSLFVLSGKCLCSLAPRETPRLFLSRQSLSIYEPHPFPSSTNSIEPNYSSRRPPPSATDLLIATVDHNAVQQEYSPETLSISIERPEEIVSRRRPLISESPLATPNTSPRGAIATFQEVEIASLIEESGQSECPVCLLQWEQDDIKPKRCSLCTKMYHAHCIEKWLTDHSTCPTCRSRVKGIALTFSQPTSVNLPTSSIVAEPHVGSSLRTWAILSPTGIVTFVMLAVLLVILIKSLSDRG